MTFEEFRHNIDRRSSSDWCTAINDARIRTRAWVQAHGELAAVSGFIAGILIVMFFRFFAWLFFLSGVAAAIIWLRIPEDNDGVAVEPDPTDP